MVECPECKVLALQCNQHGPGIQCTNCGYVPPQYKRPGTVKADKPDLINVCQELVQAMVDYQMDVEDLPPYKHRKMMARARDAIARGDALIGAASAAQKALQDLFDGCVKADSREELSEYVDGSLLDAANAALRLGKSKGMEKYG